MAEQQLYDILEDCLQRIEQGATMRDCLEAYPEQAERLHDLLLVASWVGQAQFAGNEVEQAEQRGKIRLVENARTPSQPPPQAGEGQNIAEIATSPQAGEGQNREEFSVSPPSVYGGNEGGKKKRKKRSWVSRNTVMAYAAVFALMFCGVIVILTLLGPTIGNIFSNQLNAMGGGDGSSSSSELTATRIVRMNTTTSANLQATQNAVAIVNTPIGGVNPTAGVGATVFFVPTGTPESFATQPLQLTIAGDSVATTATALSNLFLTPLPGTSTPLATATQPPQQAEGTEVAVFWTPQDEATATVTATPTTTPTPTPQPVPELFFDETRVNPFIDTEDDNLSTFAMDVDTASYTIARNYIQGSGLLPPPDAIRPEEFINYFDMNYANPENPDDAFAIHLDAAPAPFGFETHYLMRVGLQGRYVAPEDRDPAFLVFVIDISGSMSGSRLQTVKDSLEILLNHLRDDDRVGIVVYGSEARVVLNPTFVDNHNQILSAIRALQTDGSTNAEAGLRLGYRMAELNKIDNELTRVILLSDGVANVGQTGPDAILQKVQEAVDQGITLTTIGVGMGTYNDVLMERLANDGDGNYFYVDTLAEARRVFVNNLTSTLQVIAYDAKVQVEFNPEVTNRYRLIGYENRDVADADFRVDTVDAGEVGAGHSVTALYEFALENLDSEGVIGTVYIRYQDAETREVVEVSQQITTADIYASIQDAPPEFRLIAGVAEFSELLRQSFWAQSGTYGAVYNLVNPLLDELPEDVNLPELLELIRLAVQYGDR